MRPHRLPLALLALVVATLATAATGLSPGEVAALRARARAVFDLRERAREEGGIPLEPLARQLGATADTLEAAGLDSLAANARYRLAGVLGRMGRYELSIEQLTLSIAAALRARDVAAELNARSLLVDHQSNRQPELALQSARALVPRFEAIGDQRGLGDIHFTMARAWGILGRWPESLAEARLAYRHYSVGPNPRQQVSALSQVSAALRYLGRYAEAGVATDSAIALGRRGGMGLPLSRALLERGALARTAQDPAAGLEYVDEALAIDRRIGDRSHEISSRQSRTTLLVEVGRTADALAENDSLLAVPRVASDPTREIQALGTRGALLRLLERAAEAESVLVAGLRRFDAHVSRMGSDEDRAAAQVHALRARSALAMCRAEREGAASGWRTLEASRAATLERALGATAEPDLTALLARLSERHAALVQYGEAPFGGRVVFVLADGEVRMVRARTPRSDDVLLARTLLASGDAKAAGAPLARVSADLLAPVLPFLGPSVRRLVIVPPTELDGLPFEALPLGKGAGALGDRWPVSYAPSAGALDELERRVAPAGRVVAFADPVSDGLPPLPASRDEARRAASGGTCVLGRDATRERFALEAPRAAVLHVAAHAVADPSAPSRRALQLSGPGGLLTAAAVESLHCASDLVVLSGCSTAQGTRYRGEPSFGLTRAFLAGGSRSVVATLWDVDDAEAARFMAAFYSHLRAGLERDEALRRARVARVAAGSADARAFTLTGVGGEPVVALLPASGRSGGPAK